MAQQQVYNPYVTAQTQFDKVADTINLEPSVRELLRQPFVSTTSPFR